MFRLDSLAERISKMENKLKESVKWVRGLEREVGLTKEKIGTKSSGG
jgi:hypothetical protein